MSMTLDDEIDELMDYSRSIAEVAESESDEANRLSAQYFADYYKQLAEWLKELAERRKLPEIIRCGECAHSNKEYSGEMWCGICNGFGIDENSFCSFAEKRYVENG